MLFHKGTQYCIETDTVFGKLNLRYKRVWQQSNGNSMPAEQWKQPHIIYLKCFMNTVRETGNKFNKYEVHNKLHM